MDHLEIIIECSARHVHVSKADLETLFGAGYQLTNKRELSQPGQYACEERVDLVGPRGTLARVSILGPERPATQVELSLTDARALGIKVPVRESGDVAGSAGLKLVGPAGEVELAEGAIAAKRHLHLTPEVAEQYGLKDKDIVSVEVGGERGLSFGATVVRVSEKFCPRMHIDVDEFNAAGLSGEVVGIVKK